MHPFHHRPTYAAPTRAQSAVASVGQKLLPDNNNATAALPPGSGSGSVEGGQDRVNRSVLYHAATDAYTRTTQPNYYHYYYYLAFLLYSPPPFLQFDRLNQKPIDNTNISPGFLSLLLSEPTCLFLSFCLSLYLLFPSIFERNLKKAPIEKRIVWLSVVVY